VSLRARFLHRTIPGLIRVACFLALLALALMCGSVLVPRPLPVIVAMSLGHAIGASAFVCYLLAVILDATRRPAVPESSPKTAAKVDNP
jgi:cyanate permease